MNGEITKFLSAQHARVFTMKIDCWTDIRDVYTQFIL